MKRATWLYTKPRWNARVARGYFYCTMLYCDVSYIIKETSSTQGTRMLAAWHWRFKGWDDSGCAVVWSLFWRSLGCPLLPSGGLACQWFVLVSLLLICCNFLRQICWILDETKVVLGEDGLCPLPAELCWLRRGMGVSWNIQLGLVRHPKKNLWAE